MDILYHGLVGDHHECVVPISILPDPLISISALMGTVHDFSGLVTTRFMLGLAEGGLFPGINLLLTTWYNRNEQNMAIALFYAGATLAGAFGGILAFGIRHMDGVGGKAGWAWMYVACISLLPIRTSSVFLY